MFSNNFKGYILNMILVTEQMSENFLNIFLPFLQNNYRLHMIAESFKYTNKYH